MSRPLTWPSMELLEFLFAAFIVATLPQEETVKAEEDTAAAIVTPAIPLQYIEESSHHRETQETIQESHLIDESPYVKRAGMWIKEAFTF